MSDTKVLQAILDGQTQIREDLKKIEKNLGDRIDKVGLQVANLEDDCPTNDEFTSLEKRVKKLETNFASA